MTPGRSKPIWVLLTLVTVCPALPAQPKAIHDWPVFRGNSAQTGVSDAQLPDVLGPRWTFKAQNTIEGGAVIFETTVFVGAANGKLIALDLASGKKKWEYQAGGLLAVPAVRDGTVFIGDVKGKFHAIEAASGKKRWVIDTDGEIRGSANFADDKILFGSDDHHLYCVTNKGKILWHGATKEKVRSTPAISGNHVIFAGCDQTLHVLDLAKGEEIATVPLGGHCGSAPAVHGDHAYVGTMSNQFLAVDWKKKSLAWHFEAKRGAQPFYSSPAVTEHLVLAGSRDKNIHAWQRGTGILAWTFPTKGRVDSSPVVAGKRVFVGSLDGNLYVLNLGSGKELARFDLGPISSSPAVGEHSVVVATILGDVVCLGAKK